MSGTRHNCNVCGELLPKVYLHRESANTLSGRLGWGWAVSRGGSAKKKARRISYNSRRNVSRYSDQYTCVICLFHREPRKFKKLGYCIEAKELLLIRVEGEKTARRVPENGKRLPEFSNFGRRTGAPIERGIMGTLRNKPQLPILRGGEEGEYHCLITAESVTEGVPEKSVKEAPPSESEIMLHEMILLSRQRIFPHRRHLTISILTCGCWIPVYLLAHAFRNHFK